MSVLVLESDPAKAATIRHIVCSVVGAEISVVESIDHALRTLQTFTPDLVLLPTLVSPSEEAKLVTFLRTHPQGAHVETLFTPVLSPREECVKPASRGWRVWGAGRESTRRSGIDETHVFAERLSWSLQNARERRLVHDFLRGVPSDSGTGDMPSPDTITPTMIEEPAVALHESAADRRVHRRFAARELQALRAARIKSGPLVSLVDVSAGGALLESDIPLETESEAVLELITDLLHAHYVPFRVVRSQVATRGRTSRYVGACTFLAPLDIATLQGHLAGADPSSSDEGLATLRTILEPYLPQGGGEADARRAT